MPKESIVEQLNELASDDSKRSNAARLRDIIDVVESTIAAGVTRAEIVKTLSRNGFEMTLGTFNTELHRIRKKRRQQLDGG